MKSSTDIVKGKIVDVRPDGTVLIECHYDDWNTFIRRDYKECNVQMLDSRKLSDKQRKSCYALLRDIANWSGMGVDSAKEYMKLKFVAEDLQQTGDKVFSLSDAPMSLVCEFQRYLIEFMLDWDIPSSRSLLDMADDIDDYVYSCLNRKVCCICGAHSDLHHVDGVGTGRDRDEIIHEGMRVLPLCRQHHMEVHQIGKYTFRDRYHLNNGIVLDKALCKIYHLKTSDS